MPFTRWLALWTARYSNDAPYSTASCLRCASPPGSVSFMRPNWVQRCEYHGALAPWDGGMGCFQPPCGAPRESTWSPSCCCLPPCTWLPAVAIPSGLCVGVGCQRA